MFRQKHEFIVSLLGKQIQIRLKSGDNNAMCSERSTTSELPVSNHDSVEQRAVKSCIVNRSNISTSQNLISGNVSCELHVVKPHGEYEKECT